MPGIETSAQLENLKKGLAPGRGELLREISCGVNFLTDFLAAHYLERYIPEGGSKIKFVTGHKGAGKTHLLQLLEEAAEVGGVAQSADFCDFSGGLRRLGKKFLGFVDADAAQVFAGGLPGVVLEQREQPNARVAYE